MLKRSALAFSMAAAVVIPLAACSSDDGGAGAGDGDISIGIVQFASSDINSQLGINTYAAAAEEKGWDVTQVDAAGAPDKAVGAMQDLAQKGVDIIMTSTFDSKSLTAGLMAAKSAGIPVITLSGGLADGVQVNYEANYSQGKLAAEELIKQTGAEGDMLVLGYSPGRPCQFREAALMDTLEEQGLEPNITRNEIPIPGQVEASAQFADAYLAKHPDNGEGITVWTCFDDPALGVISSVKSAGRDDVKIFSMNADPGGIKAVKDGDLACTVYADVTGAAKQMAEDTPDIIEAGVDVEGKEVEFPVTLITAETVDDFIAEHPDSLEQK